MIRTFPGIFTSTYLRIYLSIDRLTDQPIHPSIQAVLTLKNLHWQSVSTIIGCPVTTAESRKSMCECFYTAAAADTSRWHPPPHFSPFIYLLSFFVLHERAAKRSTRQKKKKKTAVCSHLNTSQNTMLSNTILAIATKFRERLFSQARISVLCLLPTFSLLF